jgi:hypothetical protein
MQMPELEGAFSMIGLPEPEFFADIRELPRSVGSTKTRRDLLELARDVTLKDQRARVAYLAPPTDFRALRHRLDIIGRNGGGATELAYSRRFHVFSKDALTSEIRKFGPTVIFYAVAGVDAEAGAKSFQCRTVIPYAADDSAIHAAVAKHLTKAANTFAAKDLIKAVRDQFVAPGQIGKDIPAGQRCAFLDRVNECMTAMESEDFRDHVKRVVAAIQNSTPWTWTDKATGKKMRADAIHADELARALNITEKRGAGWQSIIGHMAELGWEHLKLGTGRVLFVRDKQAVK